ADHPRPADAEPLAAKTRDHLTAIPSGMAAVGRRVAPPKRRLETRCRTRQRTCLAAGDGAFELRLRHLGTALDAHALGFGVRLAVGAALRPGMRTQSAAPSCRDVVDG